MNLLFLPSQRTALIIGNSAYSSGSLKNPVNDASDMAAMLKKLGFSVTLKQNTNQQEMDESIREFGRQLKRTRGVGLFFYPGHGIQIGGVNYLLPVNARIEKESDVRFRSVDADMVLAEMENAENRLNVYILDACRDNPFSRSFRNAARGLATVSNAPAGTFISYSTRANQVARDGEGRNSPYTKALLENIAKPELIINDVFINVRTKVKKETGQVPWEMSSLEGRFYFTQQSDELEQRKAALEPEKQEITLEKQELETQKALYAEREQLAAEQRKLEVKRQQLAMAKRPSQPSTGETARDGRFIAYSNGTVLDTQTNLMWAGKDNGSNINWVNAKSYCENYRGGGYTDWRMPMQDELAGLYDNTKTYKSACGLDVHLTELIRLNCAWGWASETRGSDAAYFNFYSGERYWDLQSYVYYYRALPVRSGK